MKEYFSPISLIVRLTITYSLHTEYVKFMLKSFTKSTVSKIISVYLIIYKICRKWKFQCAFVLHMQYARSREYCKKYRSYNEVPVFILPTTIGECPRSLLSNTSRTKNQGILSGYGSFLVRRPVFRFKTRQNNFLPYSNCRQVIFLIKLLYYQVQKPNV
jgi:hypothetical protein